MEHENDKENEQEYRPSPYAFQRDQEGRIYQDIYRRLYLRRNLKNSDKNLTYIWKGLLEILYAINWKINVHPIAQKMVDVVQAKHKTNFTEDLDTNSPLIKQPSEDSELELIHRTSIDSKELDISPQLKTNSHS